MIICRSNNLSSTLISVTLLAIVIVAAVSYASNGLSLLSLPASPLSWRWPSSTLSFPSSNLDHSPPPPPPRLNPKTALYSMFNCDSDSCKKQNGKMNREVNKLIKELKDETMLRRNKKRDKKLEKVEAELAGARVLMRDAATRKHNNSSSSPVDDPDYVPNGNIYRNPYLFHRILQDNTVIVNQ